MQLNQAAVELVDDFGLGVDFDLDFGSRLVDQINRFVWQETIGDVAVAQLCGGHDGRVGDVHAMVHFVLFLQASQDGDRGFDRRFADQNLLETTLQGRVFLNVFAVFVQCGGAHAMQLTSGQSRFEHIARVHGALGLTSAHHGVQFIDEDNRHAFVFGQFIEHGFQALLKFPSELGTRQQGGHVQRQNPFATQRVRHLARHNALRQTFHDGGLAHARLADQNRVVFGTALQHLNGTADFVISANHGVQLAQPCPLGQINAVFFKSFSLPLRVGRIHVLPAPHSLYR